MPSNAIVKRDLGVTLFYKNMLREFIVDRGAKILVCGAGLADREAFKGLEYKDVFFSGLDMRPEVHGQDIPKFENAEELSFEDGSFDYVVMRGSIHHCRLPHKVLTELYRVSRRGFLAIEARDSMLIQFAERVGLTECYEVAGNFAGHGVNGTDIPNYIFRWTEREIEKTIKTYAPHLNHRFEYRYSSVYPVHGFKFPMNIIARALKPAYSVLCALFPRQQNQFAFFVHKSDEKVDLKPWLKLGQGGEVLVDRHWIASSYTKRKSK